MAALTLEELLKQNPVEEERYDNYLITDSLEDVVNNPEAVEQTGDMSTQEAIQKYYDQNKAFGRSFVDAASFGLADNAAGVVGGLKELAEGDNFKPIPVNEDDPMRQYAPEDEVSDIVPTAGEVFAKGYDNVVNTWDDWRDQDKENHPVASIAGEVAGFIPAPATVGPKIAKAASKGAGKLYGKFTGRKTLKEASDDFIDANYLTRKSQAEMRDLAPRGRNRTTFQQNTFESKLKDFRQAADARRKARTNYDKANLRNVDDYLASGANGKRIHFRLNPSNKTPGSTVVKNNTFRNVVPNAVGAAAYGAADAGARSLSRNLDAYTTGDDYENPFKAAAVGGTVGTVAGGITGLAPVVQNWGRGIVSGGKDLRTAATKALYLHNAANRDDKIGVIAGGAKAAEGLGKIFVSPLAKGLLGKGGTYKPKLARPSTLAKQPGDEFYTFIDDVTNFQKLIEGGMPIDKVAQRGDAQRLHKALSSAGVYFNSTEDMIKSILKGFKPDWHSLQIPATTTANETFITDIINGDK